MATIVGKIRKSPKAENKSNKDKSPKAENKSNKDKSPKAENKEK